MKVFTLVVKLTKNDALDNESIERAISESARRIKYGKYNPDGNKIMDFDGEQMGTFSII